MTDRLTDTDLAEPIHTYCTCARRMTCEKCLYAWAEECVDGGEPRVCQSDLDAFQRTVGEWADKHFPRVGWEGISGQVHHMPKEAEELVSAFNAGSYAALGEEASDILLLLLTLAHRLDFSLLDTARVVFESKKDRQHQPPDEHGTVEHVREA